MIITRQKFNEFISTLTNKMLKMLTILVAIYAGITAMNVIDTDVDLTYAQTMKQEVLEVEVVNPTLEEVIITILTDEYGLTHMEAYNGLYMLKTCENRGLNLDAINVNAGGDSVDLGLWQLNSKWQIEQKKAKGMDYVTMACAGDGYCSTRFSAQLFLDSGRSWNLWTCGKKYNF